MSTDFELIQKGHSIMSVCEMSSVFSLTLEYIGDGGSMTSIYDLTPEELCNAALRMIQIASYSSDSDEMLEYAKSALERTL